jgi:hypothetical protein
MFGNLAGDGAHADCAQFAPNDGVHAPPTPPPRVSGKNVRDLARHAHCSALGRPRSRATQRCNKVCVLPLEHDEDLTCSAEQVPSKMGIRVESTAASATAR